jgi:hypothetical protein
LPGQYDTIGRQNLDLFFNVGVLTPHIQRCFELGEFTFADTLGIRILCVSMRAMRRHDACRQGAGRAMRGRWGSSSAESAGTVGRELRHAASAGVASMATPLFGTAAHTVAVRLAFCAAVGRLPTTTIVIMGASKTGAFAAMAERAETFSGAAGAANALAIVTPMKAAATKTNSMFFAMFISLLRFVDCEHIMETDEI